MTLKELRSEKKKAAVVVNTEGFIVFVNELFEEVFGWTSEEVIGKSLSIIIPKNLQDAHNLGFSRFITTGVPKLIGKPLLLRAVDKAGREFDAEHLILAENNEGRWEIGATIKPL